MRTIAAQWFEVKIKYDKTQDDGSQKSTSELYVVDALSFTEAEETITEEMSAYISGSFDITDIKRAAYKEIAFSEDTAADRWFKAKLQYITIDEKTEKEKKTNVNFLIHAATFPGAVNNIQEMMKGSMTDYVIASVAETQIMDVFEHAAKVKGNIQEEMPEYLQGEVPAEE